MMNDDELESLRRWIEESEARSQARWRRLCRTLGWWFVIVSAFHAAMALYRPGGWVMWFNLIACAGWALNARRNFLKADRV